MWFLLMVALWNRAHHYIFMVALCNRADFCPVIYIYLSFSPRLISAAADWMSAIYFHTWRGLSTNLRCRSETCCTRLAEKQRTQKSRQKSPYGHHPTTLSGYVFATKARIDNRKIQLSSNMSSTSPHNMVNFGPLAAEIDPVV